MKGPPPRLVALEPPWRTAKRAAVRTVPKPHGGGDLGDQQGEALVEHVGQAVSHREAAEDKRAVVLDAGGLGCYGSCGGQ